MRPAKDTERHIKNVYADGLKVTTSADLDERVLNNVMETLDESKKKESAAIEPNIWRLIMKSRVVKLAAAAVIERAIPLIPAPARESGRQGADRCLRPRA